MRLVANETYIRRREKIGRYLSLGSIALLVAALVWSFVRPFTTPAGIVGWAVLLAAALAFSFVGGYYGERFAGPAAHYLGVRSALKGLDHHYVLFQHLLPLPHVLLGPDGLTVLVVRSQAGEITYRDGRWTHRQKGKFFREMAGQERLGRPEMDVEYEVRRMQQYLAKRLPGEEVPVQGVVLFTNPNLNLDVVNPPVPVFYGKKIRPWLRGSGQRLPLPERLRQRLEETLVGERIATEKAEEGDR